MVIRRINFTVVDREQMRQKYLDEFQAKRISNIINLKHETVWLIISEFNKSGIKKKKKRL